jgi:hypothetical protein
VPDLYYGQVLDNLARTISTPDVIPYFATTTQGTNQQTRQYTASYMGGWDLISAAGGFFGRYLFDKQMATLQGQLSNQQSFQLSPIDDPDKLQYLQFAFRKAAGDPTITGHDLDYLYNFFSKDPSVFHEQYFTAITGMTFAEFNKYMNSQPRPPLDSNLAEWVNATKTKKCVPKNSCYVGSSCGVWTWVVPQHSSAFTMFTLAILDIATADNTGSSVSAEAPAWGAAPSAPAPAAPPAPRAGQLPEPTEQITTGPKRVQGSPLRRRVPMFPYPAAP